MRRLEDPAAKRSVRLSKGVHVLVDGAADWDAALTISHDKVRVSFAVPWEGMLLLGTTDTLHDGEPETVAVTDGDVRQVLDEASVAVEEHRRRRARRSAGLRVLPGGEGEHRERAPRDGLHDRPERDGQRRRRQAHDVPADRTRRARPPRRARPLARGRGRFPAPTGLDRIAWPEAIDRATRNHLLHLYGSLALDVLAPAAEDPSLLEPLVPGRPDVRAQELYARTHEWALTDEDVLRRRTTGWLASTPAQA